MTHVHQARDIRAISPMISNFQTQCTLSSPEHAPAYMMVANAGVYHTVHVIKAITISLIVIGLKNSYFPLIHL